MKPLLVMPYQLKRETNGYAAWYKYEDNTIRIMVILKVIPSLP